LANRRKRAKPSGSVLDAERSAEETPLNIGGGGRGGSSMVGDLVTEGSFLKPETGFDFVQSPFGQAYMQRKPSAMTKQDVMLRLVVEMFDARGYHEYGSPNKTLTDGVADGELLLQDWYPLVRDMGKKSLKYKHTPATLTDYDMLIYWLNAYHVLVANVCSLLNLSRMGQYTRSFALLTVHLPRYMSRLIRLWRRASNLQAPPLFKVHAVQCGMINHHPKRLCYTVRFWNPSNLLASGSGGPTWTSSDDKCATMILDETKLGVFVANLEILERWLETGTAAIVDDFRAVMDVIDMTQDVIPGSWVQGLPDHKNLPGFVDDAGILSELLARGYNHKSIVTAATDQWLTFPPAAEDSVLIDRVPVIGFGERTLYDYTYLGRPKFTTLDDDITAMKADVDSKAILHGTDIHVRCYPNKNDVDMRDAFGNDSTSTIIDEQLYLDGSDSVVDVHYARNQAQASDVFGFLIDDGINVRHLWSVAAFSVLDEIALRWARFVNEAGYDRIHWAIAGDFGLNYAQVIANILGIPYLRSS
jgi:hypothetical protein